MANRTAETTMAGSKKKTAHIATIAPTSPLLCLMRLCHGTDGPTFGGS
jgi:hypothetical protein